MDYAEIKVNGYESAIAAIKDWTNKPVVKLDVENWEDFSYYIPDASLDSTVPANVMAGLVDVQQSLYKIYAFIKTGTMDARCLTTEERTALELKFKVQSGSADITAKILDIVKEMAKDMSGNQKMILILGAMVILFGAPIWKHYIDKNAETETARLLAAKIPNYEILANEADQAKASLLKASAELPSGVKIYGQQLSQDQIKQATRQTRNQSQKVHLDGSYKIIKVDMANDPLIKIKIESVAVPGQMFNTVLERDLFSEPKLQAIQAAEWSRKPVELSIDAIFLKGEVTSAEIADVKDL